MPVYLDLATRLDRKSAEDAAKEITEKFVDAAKDINSVVGGVLGKMFDGIDGSKARDELKALQEEYAKTARAAADSSRISVQQAGNVEVAIKKLHETHERYGAQASQTAAAENRVVDAWSRSGQAALDAAAAADVASKAHENLGAASGRAGSAAEGLTSTMLLTRAGIAAVALVAVEAGHKLFDMGEQWADVTDKITASTGKIGDDAQRMTDQIAAIGDKTAAPIQNIAEVYTQLGRLKDLQGSTLNDLTKQIADFDQMNKADPLNVTAFTKTMQEFHVPAAQAGRDLDTLNSVAQDARIPLNELVQSLQQAGPSADIAGLSFGQMANVLAAIDDSGVNADLALKGFRMALGNVAADSKQLQKQIKFAPDENELQRLKDVIQRIQELHQAGDDIGAIDLGKTVFGKSWADIGQAILDNKLKVDDLNTSIGTTGPTIEQQRSATKHFGDDFIIVKNQITDALKPLSENIFKAADTGMMNFEANALISIGNIKHAFDDFSISSLTPVVEQLNDFLTNPFAAIGKMFTSPDTSGHQPAPADAGAGHGGASGREHLGLPEAGQQSANNAAPAAGPPTAANINTSAPFTPIDLDPAHKPPGAETYDEWVSSQKAVQSAQNRVNDTANQLAAAQQRQKDLLDGGKATQEELNSVSEEINKANRDHLEATQELTIAQNKETEDANKEVKERAGKRQKDDNPFDSYDPFKEATKHSTGLIPQLASLLAAAAANQALGNPYGKIQAEKRGEDPSNPLYVSDVSDVSSSGGTGGGVPGAVARIFQGSAAGQSSAGGAASVPAGSSGIPIPPPGSGAGAWRDTVAATVDKYGPAMGITPANKQAWVDAIVKQIGTESGGNPNITNDHDSNGRGGTQTVAGLLQYLPSSYANSGGKLTGLPYMDPIGQIAGALFAPRNPDGTPSTSGGGIGGGHGWGPTDTPITGTPDASINVPLPGAAPSPPPAAPPWSVRPRYRPGVGFVDSTGQPTGYNPTRPPAPPSVPAPPPKPLGLPGLAPSPFDAPGPGIPLFGYATGGQVAASDTVPAMLTPKEFVVNKDAAQKNLPELQAMNSGQDPHKPSAATAGGPGPGSSRGATNSSSVTPPPPGPRIGQGTGSGFGIGGGLIGMAESAAIMAAMGAAGMAEGGVVPDPTQAAGGGKTGKGGGAGGGGGDPMTAVLNRTVGYFGQLGGIAAQGLMSSLIPGASQKGGIMDGGILSKLAGGIAGAHPSAPNTAGNTATPLARPDQGGPGRAGGDTNVGQQTIGAHVENMYVQNGQTGQDVANDLAVKSYAGYGGR